MLKSTLAVIWRRAPKRLRSWIMRLTHIQFSATAAGVVFNLDGKVLLLKHVFRPGSGWGLPGGFIEAGEQAEAALRREVFEEVGLAIESAELFSVRVFKRPRQIEIVFLCRASGDVHPTTLEISEADWFDVSNPPAGLPHDQLKLIQAGSAGILARQTYELDSK